MKANERKPNGKYYFVEKLPKVWAAMFQMAWAIFIKLDNFRPNLGNFSTK